MRKGRESDSPFHYVAQTFKVAILGTLIFVCIFFINQIHFSSYFPIKTVRIYGANRIDHEEIQMLLTPLLKRGFFGVNVEYIRDRLSQLPWVSLIYVKRNWPDQVVITLVEKNAIAKWNEDGLLSDSGEIFTPKRETYPTQVPRFIGPDGKQIVMLEYFNQIDRMLTPLHVKISQLELTPYLTWKLTLNNGMTLQIGHKDILTRLGHFVKVYPKIIGDHGPDVEYVDLRYSNGMAVRWKTVAKV